MANFTLQFGAGAGYAANDPVSSAELNAVDAEIVKCANFSDGSAHAPLADIELTGPNGIQLKAGLKLKYAARTVNRTQPMIWRQYSGTWALTGSNCAENQVAGIAFFELPTLAHGATLDAIQYRYIGGAGHANDPVDAGAAIIMPTSTLNRIDLSGVVTGIDTVSDLVVTRAQYEAVHQIIHGPGLAHTIDLINYRYYLTFSSEYGNGGSPDYVAGAQVKNVQASCILTTQPEY